MRKRFGQHFLSDKRIIDKIIQCISPRTTDHFLEIGPGQGVLTIPLLKTDAALHAIEIDRDLGQELSNLKTLYPKFELTIEDFLKWAEKNTLTTPMRIVGNLPYNITTPIFFALLPYSDSMIDCHFMIQKEVGKRIIAIPSTKAYGRLTVMMQYHYDIDYCFDVPPGAFSPPPKVDSCIIRLRPKHKKPLQALNYDLFMHLTATAFQYRRKQLSNSLKTICDSTMIERANLNPNLRPDALSVRDFVTLSNYLWQSQQCLGTHND